jgi:hypothetical protein
MTIKQIKDRDAFTTRCLMSLATARADGDTKTARVVLDALTKAHGLENHPPVG